MAAVQHGLTPIFGGASLSGTFSKPEEIEHILNLLKANGCDRIDTARIYGESEVLLGNAGAGTKHGFIIDTKAPGGMQRGSSTRSGILKLAKESMERLKMDKVEVFYLHSMDGSIALEDTLAGVQDAYKAGYFKHFGLSNYSTEAVQKVCDICKANSYVLPTHFQGNYNPVARKIESDLLPTLRKLGISFYVYSPLAGGFLTKTRDQLTGDAQGAGRFASGHRLANMYRGLYSDRPKLLESLALWEQIAKDANVSKAELAYRWVAHNSPLKAEYGDAVIIGASKIEQISGTLSALKKGPLDHNIARRIDELWEIIKDEAPLHNLENMGLEKAE